MVYKLFIEGRMDKTLFCGYLVRTPLKTKGFFIEISKGPKVHPNFLGQIFLRKAHEKRSKRGLLFGIE